MKSDKKFEWVFKIFKKVDLENENKKRDRSLWLTKEEKLR